MAASETGVADLPQGAPSRAETDVGARVVGEAQKSLAADLFQRLESQASRKHPQPSPDRGGRGLSSSRRGRRCPAAFVFPRVCCDRAAMSLRYVAAERCTRTSVRQERAMKQEEMAPADLAKLTVLYTIPGLEEVTIRRDETYRTTESGPLTMDVYYPHGVSAGSLLPAVIIVYGYSDVSLPNPFGRTFKEMGLT